MQELNNDSISIDCENCKNPVGKLPISELFLDYVIVCKKCYHTMYEISDYHIRSFLGKKLLQEWESRQQQNVIQKQEPLGEPF